MVQAVIISAIVFAGIQGLHGANVLEGNKAYSDWRSDAPGIRRHISASDLPDPYASRSIANSPTVVERPVDARLRVPFGFQVKLFASGLDQPRLIRVAPNGDVFVAESKAGRIRVLRPGEKGENVSRNGIYASGLNLPFGIAFYPNGNDPEWVYVASTDSIVRFRYRSGDLHLNEKPEIVVPTLPAGAGHWIRDIAFSQDNTKMFVSVGSASNAGETAGNIDLANPRQWAPLFRRWLKQTLLGGSSEDETERANVLVFDPRGKDRRIYASGIRNCVGMAVNPRTGELWCSTNERDGLGDNLPPDYITHVRENGFYGWPWYYIGPHEDPRHQGNHPELQDKIIVPDVLVQPHSASMQMIFYTGDQFPAEYKENIFAAEHGSWNRSVPTGYKIIRAIARDHKITGEHEDFVTGFVVDDAHVWGRPVGVAEAKDGALLFSEDGNGTIWRVAAGSGVL